MAEPRRRPPTRAQLGCPHCGSALFVRSSRTLTPLYRQMQLHCTDMDCAATFGAETCITHGIAPSLNPNPEIQLRQAPPRRAGNDNLKSGRVVARDGQPPPANDDSAAAPPDTAQN